MRIKIANYCLTKLFLSPLQGCHSTILTIKIRSKRVYSMDTVRSKSSLNVSGLQGQREKKDGNKNHIPRSHLMKNTSKSKSRSHSNDLNGQREREEQGNMNCLPRSHQSSHVRLSLHLNGPGHRAYHGDDTRTSRGHGMNTSFKGGQ